MVETKRCQHRQKPVGADDVNNAVRILHLGSTAVNTANAAYGAMPRVTQENAISVGASRARTPGTQNQASAPTRIPQSTLSAIEIGRVKLGVEPVKVLA